MPTPREALDKARDDLFWCIQERNKLEAKIRAWGPILRAVANVAQAEREMCEELEKLGGEGEVSDVMREACLEELMLLFHNLPMEVRPS